MKSTGLFPINVVKRLIPEDTKSIEEHHPSGKIIFPRSLKTYQNCGESVEKVSSDREGVGSDGLGSEYKKFLSERTPQIVVRKGNVFTFVLKLSDILFSFGSDIFH